MTTYFFVPVLYCGGKYSILRQFCRICQRLDFLKRNIFKKDKYQIGYAIVRCMKTLKIKGNLYNDSQK